MKKTNDMELEKEKRFRATNKNLLLFISILLLILGVVLLLIDPIKNFKRSQVADEGLDAVRQQIELGEDTEITFGPDVKIHDFPDYFMVYLVKRNFYVIPKKDFSEDELGTLKNLFDLMRKRRGRDIPVIRLAIQNGIADTAAYGIGFKTVGMQAVQNDFYSSGQFDFHDPNDTLY